MITLYYIFNDRTGEWLTAHRAGAQAFSKNWTDAKEFHDERKALSLADKLNCVCFGWVQ